MKKLIVVFIALFTISTAGYMGYNLYMINSLRNAVVQVRTALDKNSEASAFIGSFQQINSTYEKAKGLSLPLFKKQYSNIQSDCIKLLTESPVFTADWVSNNRSKAWANLGGKNSIKSSIADEEFVTTTKALQETCKTGLKAQDELAVLVNNSVVTRNDIAGLERVAEEIRITSQDAKEVADVGKEVFKIRGDARKEVQEGLKLIDIANQDIEKFAELNDLKTAWLNWLKAREAIYRAESILNTLPGFAEDYQNAVALALVKSDREKVKRILLEIEPHVKKVENEYLMAWRMEQSSAGRAARTFGRWLNRTTERFMQSRIGRELAVSLKTLILGTKMFYDLMDMNSRTDLLSWARSYENDMNQIMNDMDEIQSMDGWSITGKNTFIEDLANKAYEKSFRE